MSYILGFHRSVAKVTETIDAGGDAAYPPPGGKYPAGEKVGAFYIGGDTPHVWSVAEINTMAGGVDYLLPIYVRSNPGAVPAASDAAAAKAHLNAIGAPSTCAVVLDLETAVDAAYTAEFAKAVLPHLSVTYGSSGPLFGNNHPPYWVAEPGTPHPDPRAVGTQYAWDHFYDLSWWDAAFVSTHFWATKPTPPPVGPFKQVATGTESLAAVADSRKGTGSFEQEIEVIFQVTGKKASLAELAAFSAYVFETGIGVNMPKGLVYYTKNK